MTGFHRPHSLLTHAIAFCTEFYWVFLGLGYRGCSWTRCYRVFFSFFFTEFSAVEPKKKGTSRFAFAKRAASPQWRSSIGRHGAGSFSDWLPPSMGSPFDWMSGAAGDKSAANGRPASFIPTSSGNDSILIRFHLTKGGGEGLG